MLMIIYLAFAGKPAIDMSVRVKQKTSTRLRDKSKLVIVEMSEQENLVL